MFRTSKEWKALFVSRDAYWVHDGNPRRPHAKLASEKHSSGFFMAKLVTENDKLRAELMNDLLETLIERGLDIELVDCVVGPATGATKLAKTMAEVITERRGGRLCRWASPDKAQTSDGGKSMVFNDPTNSVLPGDRVLLIEDVGTTWLSAGLAEAAVMGQGGICLPFMSVIVNRSGQQDIDDKKIVALIHEFMPIWDDESTCELCRLGSEAIYPKKPATNWGLLNANYPVD